jgi:kynurenine formamidase
MEVFMSQTRLATETAGSSTAQLATLIAGCDVVDLAPLLFPNMPRWSTHPDLAIIDDSRNFEQNGYFLQTLVLPEHVGCHVDVPAHYIRAMADKTMDTFPPDCVMGPAKKVDVSQLDLGPGELLTLARFEQAAGAAGISIDVGDIAIVEFGWDKNLPGGSAERPDDWWGSNNPGFAEDLCAWLAKRRVKAVGGDTVSVDLAQVDGVVVSDFGHSKYFLPNSILIIEGLQNLAAVPASFYFLALPLKTRGGSGSPLRPVGLVPRT